ncbi:hypothetical protein CLOSTMETH_03471 [[Clostridium] methylpentosum DSM 5476]|uniref:Uncharacterized protein n=1 Tax=[Clostridium] methylpentosum DSM 5476 TaxID=537013 RepID=C0EHX6_9FIRM|nr:hypothetical protein CLOSTMETH_03471 [[Clostridium] methylpentosum DSM 5476]
MYQKLRWLCLYPEFLPIQAMHPVAGNPPLFSHRCRTTLMGCVFESERGMG